ncbi:MAG: DUF4198 domain-containing protein [Desulfobacteraceae bacterium]|nr:DUF4198 domain-containing protein [Desulfobacteraceae bacterium]
MFRLSSCSFLIPALALLFLPLHAEAHFGMITPSEAIITPDTPRTIELSVRFMHPMECQYLQMEKPKRFGVFHRGRSEDLLAGLAAATGKGPGQEGSFQYWRASYSVKRPGDYVFFLEPAPYWEAAENKFIVHYTKVCVGALGLEQGWDKPIGLETEIVPLTRPYGLWTGNLFTGRVLFKGKPVPNAEIEVEYLNDASKARVSIPSDPFVTQTLRADANGVFSYAMVRAGWWGFAALRDASWKLKKDGKPRDVEIGAVYWVKTRDMK